jgi:hypothetical protein
MNFSTKRLGLYSSKFDDIYEKISKSYPNSCVVWIDEVVNDNLLARYLQEKEDIDKYSEHQLFHGTKPQNINSILLDGFKSEYNVVSAHGKGTYFAKNASYSYNYMTKDNSKGDKHGISYMFLANVLVMNNWNKINGIYVIPKDECCFPKYVVAFYKDSNKL